MKKHFYLSVFLCLLSFSVFAESLTPGFYNSANGLKDGALKDALKSLIRDHTAITYGSGTGHTWEVFYYSDRNDEGYMMDMYCDDWSYVSTPGEVASGCNIEHSFAKSWWGGTSNDAYKDCYHLNPSNSTANSARSNYPLGVPVSNLKDNTGSLKVGKMHHPTLDVDFWVFEPKDEYKGDFARAYFYMATCYGHWSNGDIDDVLSKYNGWRVDNSDVGSKYAMQNDNYLEFQPWEQEILIQWHRQDPVSEKEIKRMDAVSNFQHNRNPFIDYPYLAEFIWGEKAGEALDMSKLVASSDATFVPGVSNGWNGEGGSTVDPEDPPTDDPTDDPQDGTITVAQAMEIGAALANGAKTTEEYVIEGYVSNISSFYNPDYGNETLWITDNPYSTAASKNEGAFEIYRGVPNTNAEVGYGAKVRITCKIKNYNNTIIENDGTNIPFEVLEPSTFVPETPTVAEAAATVQYMDAGVKHLYYSVFTGYIQSITSPYSKGVATFKMADKKDAAEGDLVAFKTSILKADTLELVPGAYVQVTGYLMNYGGTAEIAQGAIAAFVPEPGEIDDPVDPTVPSDDLLASYYAPGNVCVCIFVPEEIRCSNIVLTGSFNGWKGTVADCVPFEAVEGYDGWFVASYTPEAEPNYNGLQAKPIMLGKDGGFNWDYQVGSATKVRGGVQVVPGAYEGEVDLINFGTDAPNVLKIDSWKKNPCEAVFHTYHIEVITDGCKGLAVPYIIGAMNNWVFEQMTMDVSKSLVNNAPTYYYEKYMAEGTSYQIVSGLADEETYTITETPDWNGDSYLLQLIDDEWVRHPGDEPGSYNLLTQENPNIVFDLRADDLRWARCEEEVVEPLVLEEVNCNVRYLDKNAAELSSEVLTFHVPEAPAIDGFTFLRWEFVAGDMADGLTIQAVYKPNDDTTDLPSEIQVPGNKAMKLARDGNVYILKGDQVFTIHGQRVQ